MEFALDMYPKTSFLVVYSIASKDALALRKLCAGVDIMGSVKLSRRGRTQES